MKMKKIISIFLAISVVISLFTLNVSAASASFSFSGSASVTVGNQIKVTVNLSGSEKIGSWRFSVNYDPAYLEYVSGGDSGGGGAVLFSDSSDGINSLSKTITFQAKKIGSVTVSVAQAQVVGFDSASNMTTNSPSKKINIVAAPTLSAENNLSALSVSTGELAPAFDAKTTSYTLSVPFEVTSLAVSATPKDQKAKVAVNGADALAVGENKVDVVVTAENGKTRTYTITVTRQESELAGVTADLDGTSYSIAYDPATLQIPENFTASTADFGDKKILVYASPLESIVITYLYTESDGAWFVFDKEAQTFTEFVSLSGAASTVVILEPGKDVKIPAGFIPKTITVGEETYSAYHAENSEEKKVYLVYGMAQDGNVGFFYYDATYGTFSSYFEPAYDSEKAEKNEKELAVLSSLLEDSEEKADKMEIVALAVGTLAALLLIGLIISIATRGKKREKDFEETIIAENKEEAQELPLPEETVLEEEEAIAPVENKVPKRRAKRTLSEIGKKEEISEIADQNPSESHSEEEE